MKRLLLVTYYFPPLAGPGVFRPLRMAKYLPRAGWDVTVLTVSPRVRVLKDPGLLNDVPPATVIERTPALEPRNALIALNKLGLSAWTRRLEPLFMLPDDARGWVPFAVRAARRVLRQQHHDAVLTTAAPYSAHLVGRALKRATGLHWIADFRDEWTTNPYLTDRYPTAWHARVNRALERSVLTEADHVTAVSEPWLANLRAQVPGQPDEKFVTLPNGFDGEHFRDVAAARPDRFRIVYTGMFYGHRSPVPFLDAVRLVLQDGSIPRAELEVVLVGHTAGAAGLGETLGGVVHVIEQQPYQEALAQLQRAAVLLLVIPRAGGPGNHTGKLFNYLASGRPILALAPEPNVAADLVRASGSGEVVPPDDVAAIAAALVRLHAAWQRGEMARDRRPDVIAAYDAARQVHDWTAVLSRHPGR